MRLPLLCIFVALLAVGCTQGTLTKTFVHHSAARTHWNTAKTSCESSGGRLAIPESQEENDAIVALGIGQRVWLGGFDEGHEGVWKWLDGRTFSNGASCVAGMYCNWVPGEPNSIGSENHLMMWSADNPYSFPEGGWNDEAANSDKITGYVCEFNQPPTPSPNVCAGSCLNGACASADRTLDITVTGQVSSSLWGTIVYTQDSHVGAAAVHAGAVVVGETKTLQVTCHGPQQSFTGSTVNAITSQDYTAWPGSFSFGGTGGTTPTPTSSTPTYCEFEPCLQNQCLVQGSTFNVQVTGSTTGSVWGSEFFTDDSSLAAASVHAGLVGDGQVGVVSVTCTGHHDSYIGTTAHGVVSQNYGPWQFSYSLSAGPPMPPESNTVCSTACVTNQCPVGTTHTVQVLGVAFGRAWGSGTFTEDSSLGLAVVHAGIVQLGETALIHVICGAGQSSYTGSTSNGVSTLSYSAWPTSFTLAPAPTEPTYMPCTGACLHNKCSIQGAVKHLAVTGSITGAVWGTGHYSDDSDVATSSVHAGAVAAGESKNVVVVCAGAHESFAASSSHNVQSNAFGYWPASYSFL